MAARHTPSNAPLESGGPDHAEVAFHPPVLLGLALVLGFALRWLTPLHWLPSSLAQWLGPLLTALAFVLFLWAVITMLRQHISIPTHTPTAAVVSHGPYRFSRNPIYLSMVALQVSIGVWANSLWFLGLAAVSAVLLQWGVIAREERYLTRKFGEVYTAYTAHVRRWL